MSGQEERLSPTVSGLELERRRTAVRKILDELDLDAAVVSGSCNAVGTGGHFRWLTGLCPLTSYPQTAILPHEGLISLVAHGAFGSESRPDNDPALPFIGVRYGTPSFPAVAYTSGYDAEIVNRELRGCGIRSVGVISPENGYHGLSRRVAEDGNIRMVDITARVDQIKALKSEEEIGFIRRTAHLQDKVMEAVASYAKPGMRDFEVMAYAKFEGERLGSETGYMLGSSAAEWKAATLRLRPHQERRIGSGDTLLVQIETTGPGGYFVHLGRYLTLGRPEPEFKGAYRSMVDAQSFTASLLVDGADAAAVFSKYNTYMRSNGHQEETRLHCHGQGYDCVERPLIRNDEKMSISPGMNIGIHPSVSYPGMFVTTCDNFLTVQDGPAIRLHSTPQEILQR
jgi:Xaa-Pro aminopeptidase